MFQNSVEFNRNTVDRRRSSVAAGIWPRPGLGLQQKNQQPRRDRRTNLFALYFADYKTSHYDRRQLLCDRE